jgi:polysaccharide export outer membrane protein
MKVLLYSLFVFSLAGASAPDATPTAQRVYILGPQDSLNIRVIDLDELDPKSLGVVRVDEQGDIRLPLAGRIHAAGITCEQLEKEISRRLSSVMKDPEVTVSVAEFRSHPVSVLGAVKNPGVYQVTGPKTLFEVLSLAGGLNPEASNRIEVTRVASEGTLPLLNAAPDPSGKYYIGELNVRDIMEAKHPEANISVIANDVITVPKADMIYVVGAVKRAGGFPLNEKEHISVLQAVSLAEGLEKVAGAKHARILRQSVAGAERAEIPVNVKDILEGRAKDVPLQANDILFIPDNVAKSASMRVLEAAIQTGTGLVIWGRY